MEANPGKLLTYCDWIGFVGGQVNATDYVFNCTKSVASHVDKNCVNILMDIINPLAAGV